VPSAPDVALRRFAAVAGLSLAAKVAGLALFLLLVARLTGGS
jgi:hypothetical protein